MEKFEVHSASEEEIVFKSITDMEQAYDSILSGKQIIISFYDENEKANIGFILTDKQMEDVSSGKITFRSKEVV